MKLILLCRLNKAILRDGFHEFSVHLPLLSRIGFLKSAGNNFPNFAGLPYPSKFQKQHRQVFALTKQQELFGFQISLAP